MPYNKLFKFTPATISMLKKLTGKTVTISNGHLSFEIYDVKPEFVPVLGELLENQFGYTHSGLVFSIL